MHARKHTHTHARMHTHTHTLTSIYTVYKHMHSHTHTHTRTRTRTRTRPRTRSRSRTRTRTRTHILTYSHTHILTYSHSHTHTHTLSRLLFYNSVYLVRNALPRCQPNNGIDIMDLYLGVHLLPGSTSESGGLLPTGKVRIRANVLPSRKQTEARGSGVQTRDPEVAGSDRQ